MMDLIGFWSGVTLMIAPVVAAFLILMYYALDFVLNEASRDRFSLSKHIALKKYKNVVGVYNSEKIWRWNDSVNNVFFVNLIIGAVVWLFSLIVYKDFTPKDVEASSVVEYISIICVAATPFMSYIGTIGAMFAALFFGSRALFDVGYSLKEKLDKLEKK